MRYDDLRRERNMLQIENADLRQQLTAERQRAEKAEQDRSALSEMYNRLSKDVGLKDSACANWGQRYEQQFKRAEKAEAERDKALSENSKMLGALYSAAHALEVAATDEDGLDGDDALKVMRKVEAAINGEPFTSILDRLKALEAERDAAIDSLQATEQEHKELAEIAGEIEKMPWYDTPSFQGQIRWTQLRERARKALEENRVRPNT